MGEICTLLRWFIPFYRVRRENSDAEPLALWIKSHIIGKARPVRLLGKTLGLDHPQKWKILYISIDRSRTVASQHDRYRTYGSDVSRSELTRAQEASYPLPANLLSKGFEYTIHEVSA